MVVLGSLNGHVENVERLLSGNVSLDAIWTLNVQTLDTLLPDCPTDEFEQHQSRAPHIYVIYGILNYE